MALSPAKKAKIARAKRVTYVNSCALSTFWEGENGPWFLDAHQDGAARQFIETGDENLKAKFPRPRR